MQSVIKQFNLFIDNEMEKRITSGQQLSDTIGDLNRIAEAEEPAWLDTVDQAAGKTYGTIILQEMTEISDSDFFSACTYAMGNNRGVLPSFIVRGLKERGPAAEAFLSEYLASDILTADINSSVLTKEQLYQTDMLSAAIQLAGRLETDSMYIRLSEVFHRCISANEMFLEQLVEAMSSPAAEKHVLTLLEEDGLEDNKRVDAMQMVCNMHVKNDVLFLAMKRAFKRLGEPMQLVGAMLLFDYGDPRIVPLLRRVARDRIEKISVEKAQAQRSGSEVKPDTTQVYILLSMIHKMGGDTEELTGGADLFQ